MTDICVITSAHGEVHRVREGRSCATVATAKERRPVTLNQALVYKLPYCAACWNADYYAAVVKRGAA